jgi:hypothetical protein
MAEHRYMKTIFCAASLRPAFTFVIPLLICAFCGLAPSDLCAEQDLSPGADNPALETIQSSDLAKLLDMVGSQVIVEGVVQRIGKDDASGIHFLNFSDSRGGFVVVIFPKSLPAFEGTDFEAAYRNQLVRVEGRLSLYEDQPQIVISSPAEINVVHAADD